MSVPEPETASRSCAGSSSSEQLPSGLRCARPLPSTRPVPVPLAPAKMPVPPANCVLSGDGDGQAARVRVEADDLEVLYEAEQVQGALRED